MLDMRFRIADVGVISMYIQKFIYISKLVAWKESRVQNSNCRDLNFPIEVQKLSKIKRCYFSFEDFLPELSIGFFDVILFAAYNVYRAPHKSLMIRLCRIDYAA